MSEDRFDPQKIRTECDEVEGHHVYPDICKCEYDKKEQNRKRINEIADRWSTVPRSHVNQLIISSDMEEIKELSE